MQGARSNSASTSAYLTFGKRLTDLTMAALLIVALLLPLAVVALIIRLIMGPPVFFRQTRLGRHEKNFEILKFRTMTDNPDNSGALLPADQQMTRLGRVLRKTSFNVRLPEVVLKYDSLRRASHLDRCAS